MLSQLFCFERHMGVCVCVLYNFSTRTQQWKAKREPDWMRQWLNVQFPTAIQFCINRKWKCAPSTVYYVFCSILSVYRVFSKYIFGHYNMNAVVIDSNMTAS